MRNNKISEEPEVQEEAAATDQLELQELQNSIEEMVNSANDAQPEEMNENDYAELSAKMDSINAALDTLERHTDNISAELKRILSENRAASARNQNTA